MHDQIFGRGFGSQAQGLPLSEQRVWREYRELSERTRRLRLVQVEQTNATASIGVQESSRLRKAVRCHGIALALVKRGVQHTHYRNGNHPDAQRVEYVVAPTADLR